MACRLVKQQLEQAGILVDGLEAREAGQQFADTLWHFTRTSARGNAQSMGVIKFKIGSNVAVFPIPAANASTSQQSVWCPPWSPA